MNIWPTMDDNVRSVASTTSAHRVVCKCRSIIEDMCYCEAAYKISSRTFSTAKLSPRSTLRMDGGLARVKPVPTAFQPAWSNALIT